jgi:hypothetical protein
MSKVESWEEGNQNSEDKRQKADDRMGEAAGADFDVLNLLAFDL